MSRMPVLLLLVALGACAASDVARTSGAPAAAAPEPSADGPALETPAATPRPEATSVQEVLSLDAVDAVLRGRLLVAVDPGSRILRALEVDTGREVWRVTLGAESPASVIHDLGNGRLLVQVPGHELHTIDLEGGRVIARRPGPSAWWFVHRRGGACALMHECALAPISCEDGGELGPPLRGATISFTPLEPADDGRPTCASPLAVLGRAGDLSLYVIRLEGQEHAEVIALDESGAVRWRSSDVACESCAAVGVGSATDGSLCWTTDSVETGHTVRAFRCADGRALFTRRIASSPGYRHPPLLTGWVPEPAGLFLAGDGRAMLLAPDGAPRWTRPTRPDSLVLPEGLRAPSHPLALDRYAAVEHVDASTGRGGPRQPILGAELRIDDEGAVCLAPPGQAFDRGGAAVAAPRVFSFTRARDGSRVLLDGHAVLDLPGDGHVLGEWTGPSATCLAVAEERPGQPDRVHVLSQPR